MGEFLQKFDAGELIGLVAVSGGMLIGLLCGITAIITDNWQKLRRAEIAAALKQDMLNRGMSADDIRTVLEADSKKSKKC